MSLPVSITVPIGWIADPDGGSHLVASGTVIAESSLDVELSGSGILDGGELELDFDSTNQRPSSLGMVRGTWHVGDIVIDIGAGGEVTGASLGSAVLLGEIRVPWPDVDVYTVEIEVRSPGHVHTYVYQEVALPLDTAAWNDTLLMTTVGFSSSFLPTRCWSPPFRR